MNNPQSKVAYNVDTSYINTYKCICPISDEYDKQTKNTFYECPALLCLILVECLFSCVKPLNARVIYIFFGVNKLNFFAELQSCLSITCIKHYIKNKCSGPQKSRSVTEDNHLFGVTSVGTSFVKNCQEVHLSIMEPSYFDGIDNVFIHFDDKDGLFEGGQKLSGKINVLVKETTRIRDIKLYVTARLRIKWIDVEGGANVNFEELDFPINETIIIHEMNRNDEYSKWLFPGEKVFRFSYPLEKTLPYSLEGKYGTITYKAKAVVMIANGKTSESMEEDFFVRSRPLQLEENLMTIASLKAPLENVEYGKVGSGCFSTAKRNIEIGIKIPKPIFKQGEKV